jgi:hypothetical protein
LPSKAPPWSELPDRTGLRCRRHVWLIFAAFFSTKELTNLFRGRKSYQEIHRTPRQSGCRQAKYLKKVFQLAHCPLTLPGIALPSINHRQVITELITRLPEVGAALGDNRPAWTKAVKSVMHGLGNEILGRIVKWEFCGTHTTDDNKKCLEWLFDVAWYVKDLTQEGIVLALESEWDSNFAEIEADFCKLLATKAPVKIFLFDAQWRQTNVLMKPLQDVVTRWLQHSPEDAIYAIDFSRGKHETWFCEVGVTPLEKPPSFQLVTELSGQTLERWARWPDS